MKYLIDIFFVLFVFLCIDCSHSSTPDRDYDKNKKELTRIYEKLRSHVSIADETGVDSLACYFDKFGDASDALKAHYVVASFYMLEKERQKAYVEFKNLVNHYSPVDDDCGKDIMRCTYSNLQKLCREAKDVKLAWTWWEAALSSRLYTGESQYMLYNDKAWIFMSMNERDSCEKYLQASFENMKRYPKWDKNKKNSLCDQMEYYAARGDDAYYKMLDSVAAVHHVYSTFTAMDRGFSMMKNGNRDSADIYFRQAVHEAPRTSMHACIQLAISAKRQNNIDSLFSYFQKYVTAYDSLYFEEARTYAGHLDIVYDNHEKEMQIAKHRIQQLITCIVMVLALLLAIAGWYGMYRYRARMLEESERVHRAMRHTETLEEKLKDTIEHHERLQMMESARRKAELQQSIDDVLIKLKHYAENGGGAKDDLLTNLVALHAASAPYFAKSITLKYPNASFTDILLCVLVVQGFTQREISSLLAQERQKVRSNMIRISKNISGEPIGRMDGFKQLLDEFMV